MSNAARKARKKAGIPHARTAKTPTGALTRKEKPLSLEQQVKLAQWAAEFGRTFWESRGRVPTFPDRDALIAEGDRVHREIEENGWVDPDAAIIAELDAEYGSNSEEES